MYTDKDYLKGVILFANRENWETDAKKLQIAMREATKSYKFLRCPCCTKLHDHCSIISGCNVQDSSSFIQHHSLFLVHGRKDSGLYGNSRHCLFHCLQENVVAVRVKMTEMLENHLTSLLKIDSRWGKLGFITFLRRTSTALIHLDRLPFHNAHFKQISYSKSNPASFACLSSEDWITLIESQAETMSFAAQHDFMRWPLVHQFGFIIANAYTQLELEDG